jgi:hypothetical protein
MFTRPPYSSSSSFSSFSSNHHHLLLLIYIFIPPPIVARQRLGKHVPPATNICNDRRIVGLVVFYEVRVVLKENRRLVLPIFIRVKLILSSERVLHKDYDCKGSVKKNNPWS